MITHDITLRCKFPASLFYNHVDLCLRSGLRTIESEKKKKCWKGTKLFFFFRSYM